MISRRFYNEPISRLFANAGDQAQLNSICLYKIYFTWGKKKRVENWKRGNSLLLIWKNMGFTQVFKGLWCRYSIFFGKWSGTAWFFSFIFFIYQNFSGFSAWSQLLEISHRRGYAAHGMVLSFPTFRSLCVQSLYIEFSIKVSLVVLSKPNCHKNSGIIDIIIIIIITTTTTSVVARGS
jgi:hypothetical protein